MSDTKQPDLVQEVEELLAKPTLPGNFAAEAEDLLRRLVEEVKRSRQFGCEHCNCPCTNCGPCGDRP